MRIKKKLFKYAIHLLVLFIMMLGSSVTAQVYQHNFGTTAITSYPYTTAPTTINPDLSGSVWTNNTGSWVSYVGSTGQALGLADTSAPTASVTLTFTIAAGKQLTIDSFSFWRQRSNSGAQNWSMSINGTNVGSGTIPTTGTATGTTPVANPVTGLTGTVNVVIALSGASGVGTFRVDDFTLNGTVTGTCTAPVITSITPASGPANTIVTINGSGFAAGTGTSSVKFNGVEATSFTVVSNTVIKAVVPALATTGIITVLTNGCPGTSSVFTVLSSNCAPTPTLGDLYISELYDQQAGSGGMIEIYNPTSSTISLTGYTLQRYANISDTSPSPGYILNLSGSIGSEMTYLIACSAPNQTTCATPPFSATLGSGFNGNDKFELLKNNTVIDLVEVPFIDPGFTLIRKPDAVAPSTTYNVNEWNNTAHNTILPNNFCQDLGNHTTVPVPTNPSATITTQPISKSVCENSQTTFTVAISNPTGFTYQWKVLNTSGNWVNVTNGVNYSGATTNTLTINPALISFTNNQYYCEIVLGTCTLISNAAQLIVTPAPAAPTVTVTQPTCTTPTGTITIDTPTGLTNSIDGVNFQASPIFTNLAPGNYPVTVKNPAGCISAITMVTINPAPAAPTVADVTIVQPTCTTATGSITVNSPTGAGITYSIDGTNFGNGVTFPNLIPGTYTITVKNAAGCTSVTPVITINAVPTTPSVANVTTIQPTCTTPTGSITVNSPAGAGLTYSIDGINFVTTLTFPNLIPGTYTITVKNAAGCTSVTPLITINAVPGAPAVADVTTVQPTCTTATGSITVNSPTGAGLTYSIDGTNFVNTVTFPNLIPGTYTITVKNTAGCTSVTPVITINTVPGAPAVADVTTVQPTCTNPGGSITVNSPTGAGFTYSIDGTNFVNGITFPNLIPGTYTITVKNALGCTSVTPLITINVVPGAPAVADVTTVQPTCAVQTGSITVNSPTGAELTYSIDGTNFQNGVTFTNLTPGTYTITVKNTAGCTSVTPIITINAAPNAPAVANVTTVQPTCSTPTGSITVNSTTGAGLTYSIDGTNFQNGTTFSNLAPGSYTITVKNTEGCTSVTPSIVINAGAKAPLVSKVQGCKDVTSGKNYILEALPLDNSFDISTASFKWKNDQGNTIGNDENTFDVTQYVASNNIDTADFPLVFTVIVTTNGGCEATAGFTVESYFCNIPKGISPNNDGMNDSFNLTGMNVKKLSIFNRYGLEVYTKNDYKNEWFGQSNKNDELPTGTYYYAIETKSGDSQTGWVYINRQDK